MCCPAVAAFIARLLFQGNLRGVGWKWGAWKYEWAAYLIPIAYSSLVYVPLLAAGHGDFTRKAHNALGLTQAFHWTPHSQATLVWVSILFDATVGVIPNCLVALGEEIGWRGFLVPELAKVTSFRNIVLITGFIWALYHMPAIFGADYFKMFGAKPGWYSAMCFTGQIMGLSFISAWLRLKSGSVWPAAILHGTGNLFVESVFDPVIKHTALIGMWTGESGIGFSIGLAIIAWILWRIDSNPCAAQKSGGSQPSPSPPQQQ